MERVSRFRRTLLAALLCCWSPAAAAHAQRSLDDPDYVITNWQTEDGLPENSATAIVQTRDGYLWFGTFKGLVRFDGARFAVLDSGNTPELPSAGIVNLHLDRAGRLWASTTGGMAYAENGRWHSLASGRGWTGDYARWFAEARDGRLFVSTFDGKILQYVAGRFEQLPDPVPKPGDAFFVWLDEQDRLCVLQTGFAAAWSGSRWQPLPLSGPLVLDEHHGWLRARDGTLVDVGGRTLRRLRGALVVETRALAEPVRGFWSLAEDSSGFLWFSSFNSGLYRIAPDGSMRRFSIAGGFPAEHVRCVFEDAQRNLWVGTNGAGLVRLRPRRFASHGPAQGLPPSGFKSIAIGSDRAVHVAAYGHGLYEIAGDGSRAVRTRVPSALAYPQTVLVDRASRLWVGTYRSGLYLSDARRWTALLPRPATVEALFEDARGRVLAGVDGAVLVFSDPRTPPRRIALPTLPGPRAFAEDARGGVWAGGAGGLFRLDDDRAERIPGPDALPRFEVASLHAGGEGRLWVGTASGGLWQRAAGRWTDVGARTGLPSLAVSALEEQDGFLWAATNRGIWRAPIALLARDNDEAAAGSTWQSFGVGDGLPSVECSSAAAPAIASDARGRLWFCTLKGLASLDPARLATASAEPPVHVERIEFVDGRSLRSAFPGEAGGLKLPAGSRSFGLFFTAIDLSAPEKVLFSSRLERDGQTVATTLSGAREVHLPALDPGEYRFTVRARNGDGAWSRQTAALAFVLEPFAWQTRWFRLGALLLAGALVALVTRRLTLLRSRRARELSELQARLALVLQNTNDAVTFTGPDDTVTYMNEAAARLLGLPDTRVGSLRAPDLYPPWAWELLSGTAMDGVRRTGSWQGYSALRSSDGREIPVWQLLVAHRGEGGAIEFVSSIARDMTELNRMEEQVRQAQKMESVGLLAGGVAHDFNNVLQVIQAHAALAARPSVRPGDREAHLQHVVAAADRAARLTRQLLAFGRRQPLKLEVTDLAELVAQHLRMVRRVIGEHISIEFVAGPKVGSVRCDRTQIEQVVLNLCVNARDAMPEGGRLKIALEDLAIDPAYVAANPWARPGRYVVLSVSDTGCGMDAATRERIFEPFFTTKPSGTGLGLSVVYGIIRQHGGMVRVYSEPRAGTTFRAYLPSVARGAGEREPPPQAPPAGGRETILVAEDDPAVASVTRSILESAGYSVLLAEDGAEAVRRFEERPGSVDLLLLDVVMPRMGGREARDAILRTRPDLPVLFCSGYDPGATAPPGEAASAREPVIEKPYNPGQLLRRVREALDAASTATR